MVHPNDVEGSFGFSYQASGREYLPQPLRTIYFDAAAALKGIVIAVFQSHTGRLPEAKIGHLPNNLVRQYIDPLNQLDAETAAAITGGIEAGLDFANSNISSRGDTPPLPIFAATYNELIAKIRADHKSL